MEKGVCSGAHFKKVIVVSIFLNELVKEASMIK